jgi:hypothetical protein
MQRQGKDSKLGNLPDVGYFFHNSIDIALCNNHPDQFIRPLTNGTPGTSYLDFHFSSTD